MQDRLKEAKRRMEGASRALGQEFASVRTGRASTALLDRVTVEAYGVRTPLIQLAGVNAPDPRMITVQPYDPSLLGTIEKALMESDIGLMPSNDGKTIRLPVPQLTEERRKEMVRLAHKMSEEARIAVRNVRRDILNEFKREEKDGDMSQDDLGRAQEEIQKLTDAEVKAIDDLLARKEAEIMEV